MAAQKHVHKYHRRSINSTNVWACAWSDCTHYMPKHMEDMLPGKASICWHCGEKFLLDDINMQQEQPECHTCKPSIAKFIADQEAKAREKKIEAKELTPGDIEAFLKG